MISGVLRIAHGFPGPAMPEPISRIGMPSSDPRDTIAEFTGVAFITTETRSHGDDNQLLAASAIVMPPRALSRVV